MPTRTRTAPDATPHQVFTPHRAGLPNLIDYFSELWRRREFAAEMSRASMRGSRANTFFGQLWALLDPLLLACVYFLLIMIIRGPRGDMSPMETFAHLTGTMFLFRMARGGVNRGAKSITTSGKMLLNTNFPRLLIPLSTVRSSFVGFLPTIPLYLVFHAIAGNPWSLKMLLSTFFIGTVLVFTMGLAAIAATVNVYFRDVGNFLPYLMRLWRYLSPILWTPEQVAGIGGPVIQTMLHINPMYSMLTGYTDLLQNATWPPLYTWLTAAAWALASMTVGFLLFIARERDFTVRIL